MQIVSTKSGLLPLEASASATDVMSLSVSRRKIAIIFASAGFLLLLFFIQGVLFIRANSQTYDEAMHLAAGYSYLVTRDFRLEPQNPPLIKEILALPVFLAYRLPFNPQPQHWHQGDDFFIGRDFVYKSAIPAERLLSLSRLVNLSLGVLLIALIGWWAYRLWGGPSALLATALACWEPNLVAHSSLITTDIGVTLFIFFTVYVLWEYLINPRWWLLALTGSSVGLALVSKYSALLLFPIVSLIIALSLLIAHQPFLLPIRPLELRVRQYVLHSTAILALIVLFALLLIPSVYFFQGFEPWLSGFTRFQNLAEKGLLAFFVGEYSYQGWWNYQLVAFLIKTPIGSLFLIAASLLCYRVGTPLKRREAIFLLVPVAVIFLAMTQARVNIGLRHVLPIYPFLFVLASRLATVEFRRLRLAPLVIGVPLAFTAISSLRIAPHQLAYFNEFVGGPEQGYRYLSDSNLDWGQDLKGVKAYIEQEKLPMIYLSYFGTAPPEYYGIRYQYVPGSWPMDWPPPANKLPAFAPRKILAISVYNLQDVSTAYYPLFRWLWQRKPIAKLGYSIFVYDLSNDSDGLAKLQDSYLKAGLQAYAAQ
jgi:hypothetical protein